MPEFVRIRTDNGMETSISIEAAESFGASVLTNEDAVNPLGRPLPVTRKGGRRALPRTTVKKAAATKAAARKAAQSTAAATSGGVAADQPEEATK